MSNNHTLESLNGIRLTPRQIEQVLTDCALDLHRILILDGIDILPDGFRIRSHDLHGPLPELRFKNSGDTLENKDRLGNEVCKLTAMVKLREEMIRFLPGARFLPPTRRDGNAVVGLQAKPRTWIVEGESFIEAYRELHSQIVD
jgi:hypothetical protein